MVFIDGTNLFYRLAAEKLIVPSLAPIIERCIQKRQLIRAYLFTSAPHFEKALKIHGAGLVSEVRVVFGDAVEIGDGNFREIGVDARLVADMIYHAAVKNYDFAILISNDTDFVYSIRRVEDFGCQTKVVGICADVPYRLQQNSDSTLNLSANLLITNVWAVRS
jgi:uncharacterized LabA/DUF88 family protein